MKAEGNVIMIKCPKCGYENKDDAPYCVMCYEVLKQPINSSDKYSTDKQSTFESPKDKRRENIQIDDLISFKPETGSMLNPINYLFTLLHILVQPGEFFSAIPTDFKIGKVLIF